jgi:thymidylate synthase (FAD)
MKVVEQSWEFTFPEEIDGNKIIKQLDRIARKCYKSEDDKKKTPEELVALLIKQDHVPMLDHRIISVDITTDRGVTHELVRHRIGVAYAQESTRYCNYSKDKFGNEISVINPIRHFKTLEAFDVWSKCMDQCQESYLKLIELGETPQMARNVLPNSLKTEIVVTMSITAWRHFFYRRASKKAHPQMRELANEILIEFRKRFPILFDDVGDLSDI